MINKINHFSGEKIMKAKEDKMLEYDKFYAENHEKWAEEIFDRITIQVLYNTVIVHNTQFIIRKQYGKKIVKLFFPRIIRIFFPTFYSRLYSRRTTVMPICGRITSPFSISCMAMG